MSETRCPKCPPYGTHMLRGNPVHVSVATADRYRAEARVTRPVLIGGAS